MKYAHTVTITVFAKHEDDQIMLEDAVTHMIPFILADEKLAIKKTVAEGFEHKITILEIMLSKERHTSKFIEALKDKLGPEQIQTVKEQENRIDEECSLYIRLDKKNLLEGKYALTDSGDCVHIKINLAAFPKHRDVAIDVAKKMLQ